jgi:putative ABC transport system substrate-binding protein
VRLAAISLALVVFTTPLAVEAQQAKRVWRIGILDPNPLTWGIPVTLETALRKHGLIEKRDYVFESRWADYKSERLAEFARDLARLKVDIIVATGTEAAVAASRATRDIPVVFSEVADPVGAGLVKSLARPGANVTGVASQAGEAAGKALALLHEALPGASRVEVLWIGTSQPEAPVWSSLRASGQQLGIELRSTPVPDQASLQRRLGTLGENPPGAVFVYTNELALGYLVTLGRFARERRLPIASNSLALTWIGGLMSYARDLQKERDRTAEYVVQILKGARPADLPVQQPTEFELVINLNTAKALGLTIPPSLLLRADQVIE